MVCAVAVVCGVLREVALLKLDPGKENFDVKAGRSRFVFIKEEGD